MKDPHLRKLYTCYENAFEKSVELYKYWAEMRKFKDPRRVKIYSSVQLSDAQKKQIDDFYLTNYGRKITHIFHRHYTALTGIFDVTFFPEILHAPKFELYMHGNRMYTHVFEDKNLLPMLAASAGVKTARTLLSRVAGVWRDADNRPLSRAEFEEKLKNLGTAFAKPSVDSYGGMSCAAIHMQDGKDTLSGISAAELMYRLGPDFIIQEKIVCHPSISRLYPKSVNTFRVITYQWKDEICRCPVALRLGSGGRMVDNTSAGGMVIAVDDDGSLHDNAVTEFNQHYTQHPDTQVVFKGHKLPPLTPVLDAAVRLHRQLPQIGMCHWDFTLDENGEPLLLEANIRVGGFGLVQRSHGKGVFGDKTAEILRWTAKMEKLSHAQRKPYRFGYMEKQ